VSLSFTLSKNEKVKQYIRKKTHKPTALRFWIEGSVILLYVWPISHSYGISLVMSPQILPTSGIRAKGLCRRDSDRLILADCEYIMLDGECRRGTLT